MHVKDESKVEKGVRWKITFNANEITIIASSLKTGRRKVCEYECIDYNYRDGYKDDDILEVYRIIDEMVEDLKNG